MQQRRLPSKMRDEVGALFIEYYEAAHLQQLLPIR